MRIQKSSGLQIFLHQYFTAHGGMFQFLLTVLSGFILRHDIFNGYNMIEWQYLFAASLYAIVPVVILFVGIEKNLVGGLTSGGVKG